MRRDKSRSPLTQYRTGGSFFAQGLAHAWVPIRGRMWDAFSPVAAGVLGAGNALRTQDGKLYVNFDDAGTGTPASPVIAVGNSSGSGGPKGNVFSIQGRIRIGSGGSAQAIIGSAAAAIEFRVSSGNALELLSASVASIGTSSGSLTAGVDYDIGVSYDGTTARFYLNGLASGSGSSAQTFTPAQYYLGSRDSGGTSERLSNGSRMYYLYIWNRVRGPGEFLTLAQDPKVIFPRRRRIWVPVSAGAAGNVGSVFTSGVFGSNVFRRAA